MDFYEILDQVADLLRSQKRLTYHTLRRQFDLDDRTLEDLREELFFSHPEIVDADGRGLLWTGDVAPKPASPASSPSATTSGSDQVRPSLT